MTASALKRIGVTALAFAVLAGPARAQASGGGGPVMLDTTGSVAQPVRPARPAGNV